MVSQQETLEFIVDEFKTHFAKSLDNYMRRNRFTTEDAAKSLDTSRVSFGRYKRGAQSPVWDSYFELMLRIKEGKKPDPNRLDAIKDKLNDYYINTIRDHCKKKKVSLKKFITKMGYHESTIYQWIGTSNKHLPKLKDYFNVMSRIYTGNGAIEKIMYPLYSPDRIEKGQFLPSDEEIEFDLEDKEPAYSGTYNEGKELEEVLRKTNDWILESPKGNAHLMKATIRRLGHLCQYFKEHGLPSRETLREVLKDEFQNAGDDLFLALNIIRREENYQEWLKMNNYEDGGE